MAKGAVLKSQVADKILATFPNSFLYNNGKEIRINGTEDGVDLQIKVVLTCAKVAVEADSDIVPPSNVTSTELGMNPPESKEVIPNEPTQEEKDRLAALISKLNL